MIRVTNGVGVGFGRATIEPEPPEQDREAIVAALAGGRGEALDGWSQAALAEGVEEADLDP